MRKNPLPTQILLIIVAAFITVQTILWGSLFSLRSTMDRDASTLSIRHIEGRVRSLQEKVSLIASDYHNWTDIFLNAQDLDFERLSSNYGITAARGDIFQYAELYDGPFPSPISWRKGRGLKPQNGFIDDTTRSALNLLVQDLVVEERQTVDYFEWRDNRLVMFSSSNLLPEDKSLMDNVDREQLALAVIGRALTNEHLAKIADEFLVTALSVVRDPKGLHRTVSLPAIGVLGQPVAWFEWKPPTPGSVLFTKMAPILTISSFIFAAVFYRGAQLLRDGARKLIAQEAISYNRARTDALTSLPNRAALCEHLEKLDAGAPTNCAIIAIDLNNFKNVNDSIGHLGGDFYLKAFGERLKSLAATDTFVARVGGDEFVIVISSLRSVVQMALRKCNNLDAISNEQVEFNGVKFDITSSKGVSILQPRKFSTSELLRRADRALYAAKARGTLKPIYYDSDMECEDEVYQLIESELRRALVDGTGFAIEYQPIVTVMESSINNRFEALARWNCKGIGQVSPDKFILVAEKTGLIVRLGWLLLDIICHDLKRIGDCKIGVNISPVQLMSPSFASNFAERVLINGVRPEQIEIEVTEQIAIQDDKKVFHELTTLRECGFTVALDDFGTGFSSIGYLTRMPFDVLKIDRSFSKQKDAQLQKMVSSIVGLARAMNLRIVAEGIETSEEASRFRAFGVDYLQGFYFGRPAHITKFEAAEKEFVLVS